MSGAAQRDDRMEQENLQATGTDGVSAGPGGLKQMAAERLAAHRQRREALAASQAEREAQLREEMDAKRAGGAMHGGEGASRIREAVAERYRQSVSYREFLAAEAERALEKAHAEAEVAAMNARAVAKAQMELLEELEQWKVPVSGPQAVPEATKRERRAEKAEDKARGELAHALADIALGAQELALAHEQNEAPLLSVTEAMPSPERLREFASGLKVRLHEQLGPAAAAGPERRVYGPFPEQATAEEISELSHQIAELEQEIEFRLAPEFQEHVIESTPIQANIIAFPRQLVAPKKARPRLAEGPLREDGTPEPQLRIFEVEAEQISLEAPTEELREAPEWQRLVLGAHVPADVPDVQPEMYHAPQTAPLQLRVMAAAMDISLVGLGFVAFVVAAVEAAGPVLRGTALLTLGAAAGGSLVLFAVLYQALFFTLNEATPGMRYARLALCTFNDRNPSRKAMRRRLMSIAIAACPLGLGLVWMALDEEGLGWHDRMSRMYPRAY
jgi:uncharacterized RDD family membrane protein YckC